MTEENSAAPVFAALGDPTRLGIVSRLSASGPLSTMHLTAATVMSRQAVTKHLQALEQAGIVHSRRAGRDRVWELETARFREVSSYLAAISAEWDAAIERLRRFVEGQV
jgi:DNA-binding transcriptional ArsR family regulator